jgi:NAD(P)H-quinone oxidoreductase subunit 5
MWETLLNPKFYGVAAVLAPVLLLFLLGASSLLSRPYGERTISRLVETLIVAGLLSSLVVLGWMLATGERRVVIGPLAWVHIPDYHFALKFEFDRLSVPFVILTYILCGTIGAFANNYLHREPGYQRFHVLFALFVLGMIVTSLSGTIETLFFGWELVGLSSALLVAYFHERPAPVRNGLRVWCVYRIADAAFLVAALTMHHLTGAGDFDALTGIEAWPEGLARLSPSHALTVGLLLLVAVAGKSALIPFSGWLPRAMEGPTPSSAIFYGALSVHLGAFLLLRVSPILELSITLKVVVVVLGLTTALFAAMAARVQVDIKSLLAFASLTQVGIITAEIGCGLRYLALVHIIGHACLRTLQLLRAPTLLRDYHTLENAIGTRLRHEPRLVTPPLSEQLRKRLYRLAFERGSLDAWLNDLLVQPFLKVFRWCDAQERRWTDFLTGTASREADPDLTKQP